MTWLLFGTKFCRGKLEGGPVARFELNFYSIETTAINADRTAILYDDALFIPTTESQQNMIADTRAAHARHRCISLYRNWH